MKTMQEKAVIAAARKAAAYLKENYRNAGDNQWLTDEARDLVKAVDKLDEAEARK